MLKVLTYEHSCFATLLTLVLDFLFSIASFLANQPTQPGTAVTEAQPTPVTLGPTPVTTRPPTALPSTFEGGPSMCGQQPCHLPNITVKPVNRTENIAQWIEFECESSSYSDEISWYKDGQVLSVYPGWRYPAEDGRLAILLKSPVQDNGWYTCVASNQYGSTNASAYLNYRGFYLVFILAIHFLHRIT